MLCSCVEQAQRTRTASPSGRGLPRQAKAQDYFICAYAPTNNHPEEHKDASFVKLQAGDEEAAGNKLVLAGDFDAQNGALDPQQWHGCLKGISLRKEVMRTSAMASRLLDICVTNRLCSGTHSLIRQACTLPPGLAQRQKCGVASLLVELPHGPGVNYWPQGCHFHPRSFPQP